MHSVDIFIQRQLFILKMFPGIEHMTFVELMQYSCRGTGTVKLMYFWFFVCAELLSNFLLISNANIFYILSSGWMTCLWFCNISLLSVFLQEALEACQTRMGKLELQQQQQQALQLEGTDAKVLLGKCINIMLAIVTVILVCVSTAAKFSAPLMRSRLHVFGTFLCVCLLAFGWSNWEHLTRAVERMLVPRWGMWNVRWCSRWINFSLHNVSVPGLWHEECVGEHSWCTVAETGPSLSLYCIKLTRFHLSSVLKAKIHFYFRIL